MIDPTQPPPQFPWSGFFAVLGVLAGFLLNEVSHAWRLRLEDRRKVGQALAELLEIYRQVGVVPTGMEIFRAKLPAPIPKVAEFQIRNLFRAFIPDANAVRERYQSAVSAVAGAFPALAYDLRAKDILGPFLSQLATIVSQGGEAGAEIFLKMEDQIVNDVRPVLRELIEETAALHSWKTRREVEEVLRRKFELPKDFDNLLSQMFVQAVKQEKAAETQQPPAASNAG